MSDESNVPLTDAELDIAREVISGLGSDMSRLDTDDVKDAALAIRAYVAKTASGRLAEWEAAFETTNPAQAKAEHLAVLEKRTALQSQLADAHTKIREMIADLDEAGRAPGHSEVQ